MALKKNGEVKLDLTPAQRAAILARDSVNGVPQCQSQLHDRIVSGKRIAGSERFEVDHIIQKRYAFSILGFHFWEINTPENLLTKCQPCHTGHPESHHPDTLEAAWKFRAGNKHAYQEMVKAREDLLSQGKDYCNNRDRDQDLITAEENTQRLDQQIGRDSWWPWPSRSNPNGRKT